ncbi:MAG: 4Fe-4S binding protein [Candidatus Omnitrophica bacterium]|nr:4Fe-4S binding protein [Candidatus Omnitrophota bacterium]
MKKKWVAIRRGSQVFFFALFAGILWSTAYPLRGIIPPAAVFSIDPLLVFFTALSERVVLPGMAAAVCMVLSAVVLGRFFCGWVCPLGSCFDLWAAALRIRRDRLPPRLLNGLRRLKFAGLAVSALLAAAGVQSAWVADPLVIFGRFISLTVIPALTAALDAVLVGLMRYAGWGPLLLDLYRQWQRSFLGVHTVFFSNAAVIFAATAILCATVLAARRFWCRIVCPLGALYAAAAFSARLRRVVAGCTSCGRCARECRMGAIEPDMRYNKGECVLCMDCVYACAAQSTRFMFFGAPPRPVKKKPGKGISRRQFLLGCAALLAAGCRGRQNGRQTPAQRPEFLRPPGVQDERVFLNRCVRCGNCMSVCPTRGLQPLFFEAGLAGLWTPVLVPERGYCEFNCVQCGRVCPTGAIPRLDVADKQSRRIGTAVVNRQTCLAWHDKKECIVCEEHCPVPDKAIKVVWEIVNGVRVAQPVVDAARCIGCGICQTKCPVRPQRAIRVARR